MFPSTKIIQLPRDSPDFAPPLLDPQHQRASAGSRHQFQERLGQNMSLHGILNPCGTPQSVTSSLDSIDVPRLVPGTTWLGSQGSESSYIRPTPSHSRNVSPEQELIRYPPFEDLGPLGLTQVARFNVEPLGRIRQTARSIPYNSDKRPLKGLVGKTRLDVFGYKFRIEGETKEWKVHWDYKDGLVQIAPFFKSLKYAKTAPGKMRDANRELNRVCHSVTGGAIEFQGYWLDYDCARELATRFCYHIAGALIPIFGPEFPADCVRPGAPGFGDMLISPKTIDQALREASASQRAPRPSNVVAAMSDPCRTDTRLDNRLPAIRAEESRPRVDTPFTARTSDPYGCPPTPGETPTWTPQTGYGSPADHRARGDELQVRATAVVPFATQPVRASEPRDRSRYLSISYLLNKDDEAS